MTKTELLQKEIDDLKEQNNKLSDAIEQLTESLTKAHNVNDNYQHILKVRNKEIERLQKDLEAAKASMTPEIAIFDKDGNTDRRRIDTLIFHNSNFQGNGFEFITVIEPSGWTTCHKIEDIDMFEIV